MFQLISLQSKSVHTAIRHYIIYQWQFYMKCIRNIEVFYEVQNKETRSELSLYLERRLRLLHVNRWRLHVTQIHEYIYFRNQGYIFTGKISIVYRNIIVTCMVKQGFSSGIASSLRNNSRCITPTCCSYCIGIGCMKEKLMISLSYLERSESLLTRDT